LHVGVHRLREDLPLILFGPSVLDPLLHGLGLGSDLDVPEELEEVTPVVVGFLPPSTLCLLPERDEVEMDMRISPTQGDDEDVFRPIVVRNGLNNIGQGAIDAA
jgi:hypothetical protein